MGRETARTRDEAFRRVERACARLGLPVEGSGASRTVRISEERRLRLSGGGGVGVLRVEALLEDGETDAVQVLSAGALIERLARIARRGRVSSDVANAGEEEV